MAPSPNPSDNVKAENDGICPVVGTIERIGSEWRLIVLHVLQDGERRFSELRKETDASSSTLSRVLDELEDSGLVNRRVDEQRLATYYSLTESGRELAPVFEELREWGTDNLDHASDESA
ncbi:helix-turn-helix domain-containing protein [Halorussus sp. MSC15.2]|uniref:winged helix-turn-helix transcriptional regulator n=1 Tax=Halorussus sp. MSC15.2 TaxID=2283638 RepID=UPI0013D468CC|nr:helix-turn-helix domain-containing protein [Halorussus sp. MSC15.2]NEU56151.1 helix-turn-helix transcriptional regulator [Halorussus sp. MSC15.2]